MNQENQEHKFDAEYKDKETGEITVMCINFNCFNPVKVKDAITGFGPGEFFCSNKCRDANLADLRYR